LVDIDSGIVNNAQLWFNLLMSVFHLKYRPTKISELDLVDVAQKMKEFLGAKDIPHSFLFSGPKGAGKTSAARILARAINCEDRQNGEPCDKCDNCKEILNGRAMDIIEMDGASNRGIEDVRSLKEKSYLLPSKLNYKVFIIDEVHMLTKDAFNALLKLIEEPPKHTIFILCTTDAEKIPDTVISRLVRLDFRRGGKKELRNSLDKIIKGEKMELDETAIDFILSRSDGSFRNLQKHFNEMFLSLGKKITLKMTQDFYLAKSGSYSEVDFEKDLGEKNIKIILEKLEKMANEGMDFVSFREKLLEYFQQKILLNFDVGEGERSVFSLVELEELVNLLIRASKQEKETEIDQLPLELVIIDFIGENQEKKIIKKTEEVIENKKEVSFVKNREDFSKKVEENKEKDTEVEVVNVIKMDVTGINLDKIEQSWGNVLLAIKPFNHSVEAFLRASRPIKFSGRNLTLEVFYPFHKDRLEEAKNRKIVEEGLFKVLGVELVFDCILGKSKKQPLIIQNNTPVKNISEQLVDNNKEGQDLYDVAKDIFG
jgi:DNA polymerase-3 subunit gamma/tau